LLFVRNVADVGVMAVNVDLTRARQIQVRAARDVVRELRRGSCSGHQLFPELVCFAADFTAGQVARLEMRERVLRN
jgi:hypothetical protein